MDPLSTKFVRVDLRYPVDGEVVEGLACIRSKQLKVASTGNAYLVVNLGHRDGNTTVRIWANEVPQWESFAEGDGVRVRLRGKAGKPPFGPEWTVVAVAKVEANHPIRDDLLPPCPIPLGVLRMRWDALVAQLTEPAALLLRVIIEDVGEELYWRTPAAERMHHAVAPNGLAWHSIEVAEFALAIARAVPTYRDTLSIDVLTIGSILHDVGKTVEYEVVPGIGIRRAAIGGARYHTTLGIELVVRAVTIHRDRLDRGGVYRWMIDQLLSVIESHHALKEWGSPSAPASRESWIIHWADQNSAKLQSMTADLETAAEGDGEGWYRPADPRAKPLQRFDLLDEKVRRRASRLAANRAMEAESVPTDASGTPPISSTTEAEGAPAAPSVETPQQDEDRGHPASLVRVIIRPETL